MSEFKIGHLAICIDEPGPHCRVRKGQTYRVVYDESPEGLIQVRGDDTDGPVWVSAYRMAPVNPPKRKQPTAAQLTTLRAIQLAGKIDRLPWGWKIGSYNVSATVPKALLNHRWIEHRDDPKSDGPGPYVLTKAARLFLPQI